MTTDKEYAGYGPWMPQWEGEPSGRPQQGHPGAPPHWGRPGGQGEDGGRHRGGPWGPPRQWDRQGPWSHGKRDQQGPGGPQNAPQSAWRYGAGAEDHTQWGPRGPDGPQEGDRGRRWGPCGGRWQHGDQRETSCQGPSWTGLALTGVGVLGLYKLFQGGRRQQ